MESYEDESNPGYLGTMEQREKEEMEFYTDLAVQEMQRWIEAITRKRFKYPEEPKASLSDGILLCELLNGIMPGTVKRINRLPTPMAGMDNINVFIDASKRHFGLKEAQLFTPTDLQDFSERFRDNERSADELKEAEDKKIRNVAITVFWLARQVQGVFAGPEIDFTNFTALVNAKALTTSPNSSSPFHQHQYSSSGDWTEPDSTHYKHSRASSKDSIDDMIRRKERLYSSSDSLDDLDRPSSQNSDRSGLRRTSTAQPAYDPLQFIALKPATNLAQKAEKQLELVQETKKRRESTDKDEAEWQNNLSSWKQRRKSSRKSAGTLPERVVNEIVSDKYEQFERLHTDTDPQHYSQSQSSQSYDDDEAFDSPSTHQKSSSDASSPRSEIIPESTREFKPHSDDSNPVLDIIERATIKQVESLPLQSSGSQHSVGKNKYRAKLITEVGSDDGFGFTIKGGKDKCLPITIETVTNDSAADQAELLEGDEVLEINDEVVGDRNKGYCMLLINGSLQKNGQLDMYIKQDLSKAVSAAAKQRKQSSTAAPKSILDIYDTVEINPAEEDGVDGQMMSTRGKDSDKMEDELTRREIERAYRQILDGGYDSAVSTLRSEPTLEDRQAYLDNQQERVTATTVHATYMNPPSEYASPREYEEREFVSEESYDRNQHQSSDKHFADDQESEESMETFEQIHDKVTKDFEEVAPSLVKKDVRLEKRSKKMDEDNRRRMEEWQKQQELRQQEQYEKEQNEIQREIERSRQAAEESDRNRKILSEASSPTDVEDTTSALTSLRLGISASKERETRDKAVQRLLEIKARYSRDAPNTDNDTDGRHKHSAPANQHSDEIDDDDDDLAKYRITSAKEPESNEMRDHYTANYYDYKPPVDSGKTAPKETPYLADVYKYYDEDLPTNLGERDPTPPPMSRKDVMNMNKKSTPWQDAKNLPADADKSWERKEVIAPVNDAVAPRRHPEVQHQQQDDRRKSVPARPHWMTEEADEPAPLPVNSQRSVDRQTDVDPSLPSTLRKEDVLKMTREKARFSAQTRRASEAPVRSQPINHKAESDQTDGKPAQRKSMGFFSNRAMFEQQSRDADRYWADQSKESKKKVPAKAGPFRKAVSTVTPPHIQRENRSKSVDVRPPPNREGIVRSADASDAAYERMKELAQMKQLREAEAAKAEEDEQERRNRERKIRDERQRELAEIRKMNQQYEAAHMESTQQQRQQEYHGDGRGSSRSDELDMARKRMAREAEELARAQMKHDQEVKSIHGVDMQEERRRRDIENSRPSHGDDEHRHSRELGDLDRDDRVDAMARRRHQEMVEQSRRDQQRREEARQVEQRRQQQRPKQQPSHPQQLHHSQQQQQQEWRPQQQQEQVYSTNAPPTYSKPNTVNGSSRYRMNSPPKDYPNTNNQLVSPEETNARYEGTYVPPGGSGRREPSGRAEPSRHDSNSRIYQTPAAAKQQEHRSNPVRDEDRDIYGRSQDMRSDKPLSQNSQRVSPPYTSTAQSRLMAPRPYEARQPPIGRNVNSLPQDSYDRDIPAPKPFDRLDGSHQRQDSYDRNLCSGYSSGNEGYTDPIRPHPSIPNYNRPPDSSKQQSRNDDPRYSHNHKNGAPNLYNNNDVYKRDMYSKDGSGETSLAPSKPPRSQQQQRPSNEDDLITVSAKYSCAYCSKELGKGAAMVIESLGLYYHVECFRCCVCHSLLSNGQMGADVRVRVNRLHCKNCYSNDDAGIKYSAV